VDEIIDEFFPIFRNFGDFLEDAEIELFDVTNPLIIV
jgi:hypothetical protein